MRIKKIFGKRWVKLIDHIYKELKKNIFYKTTTVF